MIDRVTQFGISPSRIGSANMQGLTLWPEERAEMHVPPQAEVEAGPEGEGQPQFFLVGFILLLAILWVVRQNSEALQRDVLGINVYNLVVIGVTAVIFISLGKVITSRWPVPGLTPLFASL